LNVRPFSDFVVYVFAHTQPQFHPAALALLCAIVLSLLFMMTLLALSPLLEGFSGAAVRSVEQHAKCKSFPVRCC